MVKTMDDLKSELLDRTREERLELLDTLAESIEPDEEIDRAWRAEIRRRVEEIRSGKVELIDNDEVFADLRARFG